MASHRLCVWLLVWVCEIGLTFAEQGLDPRLDHNYVLPDEVRLTYAGTSEGASCAFPFIDLDEAHFHPTRENENARFWCSSTYDVAVDYLWGYVFHTKCRQGENGRDYMGNFNFPEEGVCIDWSISNDYSSLEIFPDASHTTLQNNCRNPSAAVLPWCEVTGGSHWYSNCSSVPLCDMCRGRVSDDPGGAFLTSSSINETDGELHSADFGWLNTTSVDVGGVIHAGAWCAADTDYDPWIMVTLSEVYRIIGIITQGRQDADNWIWSYKVQYTVDDVSLPQPNFTTVQNGTDGDRLFFTPEHRDMLEAYMFDEPFLALSVQILVWNWGPLACLRFDLEGCPDSDGCNPDPCLNGATCVDLANHRALCDCVPGWEGKDCGQMIDMCQDQPCENGGICTSSLNAYVCTCADGVFSGTHCEIGTVSSCKAAVEAGLTLSGFYSIGLVPDGPCEITYPEFEAWDSNNMDSYDKVDGITQPACEQLCLDDDGCLSMNYIYAPESCLLRDHYGSRIVTLRPSLGTTGLKYCPGLRKLYCDFTNATLPTTVIHHAMPVNYTGGVSGYDSTTRYHYASYLPLSMAEINHIKKNSLTCSQSLNFHCFSSVASSTGLLFYGLQPMDLLEPFIPGNEDTCDCLLEDTCSEAGVNKCNCQHYSAVWTNDHGTFRDKAVLPVMGIQLKSRSSSRKLKFDLGPLRCVETTFDVVECASDPCANDGVCTDGLYHYNCSCSTGWEGANCETDINYCDSDPCLNDGVCFDMAGMFDCNCPSGFSGERCEIDENECDSSPCLNDASCVNMGGRWRCLCATGFFGLDCSSDFNECDSSPCLHSGVCSDEPGYFNCSCIDGYEGDDCGQEIDECASMPCLHGGNCIDGLTSYSCDCSGGYDGTNCEQEMNECASAPCVNGGTCNDLMGSFLCDCLPAFEGTQCEINIDECESSPCQSGECVDGDLAFTCACFSGYRGALCEEEIDECQSDPCGENGRCVDDTDGFACECDPGFTDEFCATDINECNSFPCLNGGSCFNNISLFNCQCLPGWGGDRCESAVTDGAWSGWGRWSACTNGCGVGLRTRTRECNNPPPRSGGADCEENGSEAELCIANGCTDVDGTWGTWGSWSHCSVSCGWGQMTRTRRCDNPPQTGEGADCRGSPNSTVACKERICGVSVDGGWGAWGPWSGCSDSCGVGTKLRTRTCSYPVPAYGGAPCRGSDLGATSCRTIACPAYEVCGEWSAWGDCSATCGEGVRIREQTCHLQNELLSSIQMARKGVSEGSLSEAEVEEYPTWYWNISLSIQRHGIESCQDKTCPEHMCVSCHSEFATTSESLTCKGPKKACGEGFPVCVYSFDPLGTSPGVTKGCAKKQQCGNMSVECENLKTQTVAHITWDGDWTQAHLVPHPDTLLQAWHALTEPCHICCANGMCNYNDLPAVVLTLSGAGIPQGELLTLLLAAILSAVCLY